MEGAGGGKEWREATKVQDYQWWGVQVEQPYVVAAVNGGEARVSSTEVASKRWSCREDE